MVRDLLFVYEMVEFYLNFFSFEKIIFGNISILIIFLIFRWEYREWIFNVDFLVVEFSLFEFVLLWVGLYFWKYFFVF